MSSPPKPEVPALPEAKSPPAMPPTQSVLPQLRGRGFRRGSMIGANFGSALEALWANRLRSLLTALGIFIGVAAVIAALTLTQGVGVAINNRISSVGVNTIFLRNGMANERGAFGAGEPSRPFGLQDAYHLEELSADADRLIQRVGPGRIEEVLLHGIPDDCDRLASRLIAGAKPCTFGNRPVFDRLIVGTDALNAGILILAAEN